MSIGLKNLRTQYELNHIGSHITYPTKGKAVGIGGGWGDQILIRYVYPIQDRGQIAPTTTLLDPSGFSDLPSALKDYKENQNCPTFETSRTKPGDEEKD